MAFLSLSYFLCLLALFFIVFYLLIKVFLRFSFISCLSFDRVSYVVLDNISLTCFFMLFVCGLTVLPFVFHYMGSYNLGVVLYFLILGFIGVMSFLIFRGDFLFTLIGWEYLGLVRYLLILFLCKLTSVRASLITVFASRFGDVGLFVLVGFGVFWLDLPFLYSVILLLVVFTKSACFPFTSWLLEAMRAPTPVSCLVHSSTLVAAGVWFSLRYRSVFSDYSLELLGLFSIYTIILTAFSALYLVDLKKLVALSTCNNISWCVLCFSLGDLVTCILFLITHGISKCLLFISVGDLMSSSGGRQSSLGVYPGRYRGYWNPLINSVLLASLCGLPYLGIFLRKHVLVSYRSLGGSLFFYYSCCFCVVLSFAYTYRFGFLLLRRLGGLRQGAFCEFGVYCFISLLPTLVCFFRSFFYPDYNMYREFYSLLYLFFWIHLLGLFLGLFFYSIISYFHDSVVWSRSLSGCDFLVGLFYKAGGFISSFFYSLCYRWEVSFCKVLYDIFFYFFNFSFLGVVKLCILGVLWVLIFFFLLY